MHPPVYCSACGKPNAPDAKFCNECAKPLFNAQQNSAPLTQPVWQPPAQIPCPQCRMMNPASNQNCYLCRASMVHQPPARPTVQPTPADPNSIGYKIGKFWAARNETQKALLFFFVAVSVIAFFGLIFSNQKSGAKPGSAAFNDTPTAKAPAPPPPRTDLNAQVRFTGTQFVITNKETVDLTNVKMEINGGIFSGGYQLLHDRMKASETYTVGALQFADSDGKRFNPFQMKPQKFTISADTSIGHLFYVGGWN